MLYLHIFLAKITLTIWQTTYYMLWVIPSSDWKLSKSKVCLLELFWSVSWAKSVRTLMSTDQLQYITSSMLCNVFLREENMRWGTEIVHSLSSYQIANYREQRTNSSFTIDIMSVLQITNYFHHHYTIFNYSQKVTIEHLATSACVFWLYVQNWWGDVVNRRSWNKHSWENRRQLQPGMHITTFYKLCSNCVYQWGKK